MTINVPVGDGVLEDPEESPRASRGSRPPLERPHNRADVAGPSGTALQATLERLGMPLVVEGNVEQVRAQLEEQGRDSGGRGVGQGQGRVQADCA